MEKIITIDEYLKAKQVIREYEKQLGEIKIINTIVIRDNVPEDYWFAYGKKLLNSF